MTRKKSSFLTFCFSLLPGAGQMYMGFMKRGASLMAAFFLLIFLSTWLNLSPLMFAMPVIWFFAFFDTFNLRSMPDEQFYALKDEFILIPEISRDKAKLLQQKYHNIIALILIIIGVTVLWNNVLDLLYSIIPSELNKYIFGIRYYLPQLLVGCAIIALGLYLIRGKKKELDNADKVEAFQDKGGM